MCKTIDITFSNYVEYSNADDHQRVDVENNFYSKINRDCNYFTDEEFNMKLHKVNGFSIIHFNCRSIKTCFDELQQYLTDIKKII